MPGQCGLSYTRNKFMSILESDFYRGKKDHISYTVTINFSVWLQSQLGHWTASLAPSTVLLVDVFSWRATVATLIFSSDKKKWHEKTLNINGCGNHFVLCCFHSTNNQPYIIKLYCNSNSSLLETTSYICCILKLCKPISANVIKKKWEHEKYFHL